MCTKNMKMSQILDGTRMARMGKMLPIIQSKPLSAGFVNGAIKKNTDKVVEMVFRLKQSFVKMCPFLY